VSDDLRDEEADDGRAEGPDSGHGDTEIAYDLSDWTDARLAELGRRLDARGIPHDFDGPELVVDPAHEDEVDRLLTATPPSTAGADGEHGEVSYDCSPWAGETRRLLGALLETRDIPHAWEGTVLVVRAEHEATVDELVDEMAATAVAALEEGEPRVGYEMGGWSAQSQNNLVESLGAEGIPHEWDAEGDLVVHERDAERVEQLVDELGEPDGGEEMDGLELHERLDSLFVAADRLAHNPEDRTGGRDAVAATEALRVAAVPFGVEAGQWRRLIGQANALVAALRGASTHDDDDESEPGPDPEDPGPDQGQGEGHLGVGDAARVVRDLLRQFV